MDKTKARYFQPAEWIHEILTALRAREPDEPYGKIVSFTFEDLRAAGLCEDDDDWIILTNRLAIQDGIELSSKRGSLARPDRRHLAGPDLAVRRAINDLAQRSALKPRLVDLREVAKRAACDGAFVETVLEQIAHGPYSVQVIGRLSPDFISIGSLDAGPTAPTTTRVPTVFHDPRELPLYALVDGSKSVGKGASGTVVLRTVRRQTTWASPGTVVALKVTSERDLERLHGSIENGRERMLREFSISRKHDSPRLFRGLDLLVSETEGGQLGPTKEYVLVMEYVDGKTLDLDAIGELTPRERLEAGAELAAALAKFHDLGGFHRDVKPRNAVRRPNGTVVLVDYGIAKASDDDAMTGSDESGMTPLYAAPEVLRSPTEATCEADVYSLGCSIYEILFGRPAFAGVHRLDIARKKEGGPLSWVSAPDEPAGFRALVQRMTSPDPLCRPSAADVHDELRRFVLNCPE